MRAEHDIVNQEAILQRKDSVVMHTVIHYTYVLAQCQPKKWGTQLFNLFLS